MSARKINPIFPLLFSLLANTVFAQDPPPGTKWKLDKVEVAGLKIQNQEEVIAVTGLQIGQTVDLDAIKAATTKLAGAGLFKKVAYRYRYNAELIEVTFDVEEAKAEKLNCVFDNFVWFSEQEIRDAIVKEVPDFDGAASQGDFVVGKIKQTLARMLQEKKIAGEVTHEVNLDVSSGRQENIFKVKDANLKVCSIRLAGAAAELMAVLNKEAEPMLKTDYSRMESGLFAKAALIPVYRQRGYLKARFNPVQAEPGTDGDCKKGVVVTLPVEEGPQFRWEKAVWSGNQVLPSQDLDSALAMKPGAIADEPKITRGLRDVAQAYGKKGYVMANLKISQEFNDAQKLVSYQISIEEGAQYRMGQLLIAGLPENEIKRLQDRWRIKPGDVFDATYPGEVVGKAMRDGALSSESMAKDYGAQFKPDHEKLTVDVVIQFK